MLNVQSTFLFVRVRHISSSTAFKAPIFGLQDNYQVSRLKLSVHLYRLRLESSIRLVQSGLCICMAGEEKDGRKVYAQSWLGYLQILADLSSYVWQTGNFQNCLRSSLFENDSFPFFPLTRFKSRFICAIRNFKLNRNEQIYRMMHFPSTWQQFNFKYFQQNISEKQA